MGLGITSDHDISGIVKISPVDGMSALFELYGLAHQAEGYLMVARNEYLNEAVTSIESTDIRHFIGIQLIIDFLSENRSTIFALSSLYSSLLAVFYISLLSYIFYTSYTNFILYISFAIQSTALRQCLKWKNRRL